MLINFLRVLVLYPLIVFGIRLMGKRQIGQMQPTELVIAMMISNTATLPLEDTELPLLSGLVPMLMLIALEVLLSWGALRSKTFRRLMLGSPQVVIRDGKPDLRVMRALRLSIDDLLTALRTLGIFDVAEVQLALVETNGTISAYQQAKYRTPTCDDLKLAVKNEDPPEVLISDGCISEEGIRAAGLTRKKFAAMLKERGLQPEELFLLTGTAEKITCLVRKEDAAE